MRQLISAGVLSPVFWTGAALGVLLLGSVGCVSAKAYRELEYTLQKEREQRLQAQEKLRQLQRKLQERAPESEESIKERLALEEQVAKLKQAVAKLEEEKIQLMEQVPGSEGTVVFEFPPEVRARLKLAVNDSTGGLILEHELLFGRSGATLTAEGKALVRNVAEALKVGQLAGRRIYVDGHTDSRPVKMNLQLNPDNWVLGARRADSVVRELIAAGVDPKRITLRSFAYTLPLYPERPESPRNRRVEIVIGPPLRAEGESGG